jgi:hypothetical protein
MIMTMIPFVLMVSDNSSVIDNDKDNDNDKINKDKKR